MGSRDRVEMRARRRLLCYPGGAERARQLNGGVAFNARAVNTFFCGSRPLRSAWASGRCRSWRTPEHIQRLENQRRSRSRRFQVHIAKSVSLIVSAKMMSQIICAIYGALCRQGGGGMSYMDHEPRVLQWEQPMSLDAHGTTCRIGTN